MENEILKSSDEWQKKCIEFVKVIDPDGWDRTHFKANWAEPITKAEFIQRLMHSTIRPIDYKGFLKWEMNPDE